jgi:hypothetical protein
MWRAAPCLLLSSLVEGLACWLLLQALFTKSLHGGQLQPGAAFAWCSHHTRQTKLPKVSEFPHIKTNQELHSPVLMPGAHASAHRQAAVLPAFLVSVLALGCQNAETHPCVWWQGCDQLVIYKCSHIWGAVHLAQKCNGLEEQAALLSLQHCPGLPGTKHTQVGTSNAF